MASLRCKQIAEGNMCKLLLFSDSESEDESTDGK
jgi:hypothetical protein